MQQIEIPAGALYHQLLASGGMQALEARRTRVVEAEQHADGRWYFQSAGARYSISAEAVRVLDERPERSRGATTDPGRISPFGVRTSCARWRAGVSTKSAQCSAPSCELA
jgi:hypothetical protein